MKTDDINSAMLEKSIHKVFLKNGKSTSVTKYIIRDHAKRENIHRLKDYKYSLQGG